MRVVILAPVGRDARLLSDTLAGMGIATAIASDATVMLGMIADGSGAAIVAEETLGSDFILSLTTWLEAQPPWSDMPFLILTSTGRPTRQSYLRAQAIQTLGKLYTHRAPCAARNHREFRTRRPARPNAAVRDPEPPGGAAQGKRRPRAVCAFGQSRPARTSPQHRHIQRSAGGRIRGGAG